MSTLPALSRLQTADTHLRRHSSADSILELPMLQYTIISVLCTAAFEAPSTAAFMSLKSRLCRNFIMLSV